MTAIDTSDRGQLGVTPPASPPEGDPPTRRGLPVWLVGGLILLVAAVAGLAIWALQLQVENAELRGQLEMAEQFLGPPDDLEEEGGFGDLADARTLAAGVPVTLGGDDVRTFAIEGREGVVLAATVEREGLQPELALLLLDEGGDWVAEVWDDGSAEVLQLHRLLDGSPHFLVVSPYLEGEVTFSYELLEVDGEPFVLLELVGDGRDLPARHAIEGRADHLLIVDLRASSGMGTIDPVLQLRDPAGDHVADDDDGGGNLDARIAVLLDQDGTYTVIADQVGSGAGTFELTAELLPLAAG
jgi:hypothetical protein